jgi:hypothetical protein
MRISFPAFGKTNNSGSDCTGGGCEMQGRQRMARALSLCWKFGYPSLDGSRHARIFDSCESSNCLRLIIFTRRDNDQVCSMLAQASSSRVRCHIEGEFYG